MKTFLIISCLLATAAAISTKNLSKLSEAWKGPIAKCGEQYGYPGLTLQDIYAKQDMPPLSNIPCVHACVQRSLGVLTLRGIYRPKASEYINSIFADQSEVAAKLNLAATHCEAVTKKYAQNECALAYHYAHCFLHSNEY